MSARRPAAASIADKRWLTKSEAMAYTEYLTEKSFDEWILPHVSKYRGGKCILFDKCELDGRMLQLKIC